MWFYNPAYQERQSPFPHSLSLSWPCDLLWPIECNGTHDVWVLSPDPKKGCPLLLLECCSFHVNKPCFTCWRIRSHVEEKQGLPASSQPGPGKWPTGHKTHEWVHPTPVKPTVQYRHVREHSQHQPRLLRLEELPRQLSFGVISYTTQPKWHRTDGCNPLHPLRQASNVTWHLMRSR